MSDMGLPDPTGLNEAMAPAIEDIRDEAHDVIGRGADAIYDTIMGPEGDHYRTGVENIGRILMDSDFSWLDEWLGGKNESTEEARMDSADYYDSDGSDLTEQETGRSTIKEIHFDSISKETAFIAEKRVTEIGIKIKSKLFLTIFFNSLVLS